MEGDTPAFMYLMPNGLADSEYVDHGTWGGRFDINKKQGIRGMSCMNGEDAAYDPYYMYGNDSSGNNSIKKFKQAYDNDFAARMDWSITSNYAGANHHPIAIVEGNDTRDVIYVDAQAGSDIVLSAQGSSDPDSDAISYKWEHYDAGRSFTGSVGLSADTSMNVTVSVPTGIAGEKIHILLTIKDNGSPNLFAYRRVIINVQ